MLRHFLDRRSSLTPGATDRLARGSANEITPRVGGLAQYDAGRDDAGDRRRGQVAQARRGLRVSA